jgi:hypothetical protein
MMSYLCLVTTQNALRTVEIQRALLLFRCDICSGTIVQINKS